MKALLRYNNSKEQNGGIIETKKKKVLKVFMIIGIVILSLLIISAGLFAIYWHNNIHWYDSYEDALKTVSAQEKQAPLPDGNVINYGEVENDKPALLLIHGQMSKWQDYALIPAEMFEERMKKVMEFASARNDD